ncbi:MAG: hypothetical protein HDR12_14295 [Lachnospiraceae bacterium]|nr:hypothetical protein [Lachnospiraceae bacterium]
MKTTDLTTKEKDLEVSYGMFNLVQEIREGAYTSLKYLYTDITDIRKYYIRLGFHLDEFERYKYYEDFGFLTLEDFCDKNLGLDKSAVSRCINVYREFNASNYVTYKNGVAQKGSAIELSEQWENYSYTQLCEMLPLNSKQRKDIKPDMTIKEVREYKKSLKEKDTASSVASTQQEFIPFDINRYDNTSSKEVRKELIKKCSAIDENVVFYIYDKNGNLVDGNVWCHLLYAKGGRYFFRLEQSRDNKK